MKVLITGPNHERQTEIINKLEESGYKVLRKSFMEQVSSILESGKDIHSELENLIDKRILTEQDLVFSGVEIIFLNGGPHDIQALQDRRYIDLPKQGYSKIFLCGDRNATQEYGGYETIYTEALKLPLSRGKVPRYSVKTTEQVNFILDELGL